MFCFYLPLVASSDLLRSSPTARLSLNKSPLSESKASICIWPSSSLEVVETVRSPFPFRRLMAAVSILRDLVSCR